MANPSPICEVQDGSGDWQSTVDGVDVTPANTVTIRLASQAGVDSWLIQCITTDDTSDAGTVTGSLTIDSQNKTATFTAPAAGKAYRFRSRINGGVDRNGVRRSDYETTFCIYTLTSGSRRVLAADETTEGDSTFGWIVWINDMIRNFGSGGGGGGDPDGVGLPIGVNHQFLYYNGGSAVGATGLRYNPTTMAVTIDRPILGGTAVFTGTDLSAQGLADFKPYSAERQFSTSDDSVANVYAFVLPDNSTSNVVAEVSAVASGGAYGGTYIRRGMIRVSNGVGTFVPIDLSADIEHTGGGFTGLSVGSGIALGVSGMTGFANVKGPTGITVGFGAVFTVQPRRF